MMTTALVEKEERQAVAGHVPAGCICDRSDCPAPAGVRADLHGQDFYFCTHHWAELTEARKGQAGPSGAP
jgi:hypothetical protein